MPDRFRFLWVGLIAVVGLGAGAGISCKPSAQECTPSFRLLSPDQAEVKTGSLEVTASWVGIGCRADLDRMTDEEVERARDALLKIAEKQSFKLTIVKQDASVRAAFVESVNAAVGRRVITDLYLEKVLIRENVAS
jgi:hypothetical protein